MTSIREAATKAHEQAQAAEQARRSAEFQERQDRLFRGFQESIAKLEQEMGGGEIPYVALCHRAYAWPHNPDYVYATIDGLVFVYGEGWSGSRSGFAAALPCSTGDERPACGDGVMLDGHPGLWLERLGLFIEETARRDNPKDPPRCVECVYKQRGEDDKPS